MATESLTESPREGRSNIWTPSELAGDHNPKISTNSRHKYLQNDHRCFNILLSFHLMKSIILNKKFQALKKEMSPFSTCFDIVLLGAAMQCHVSKLCGLNATKINGNNQNLAGNECISNRDVSLLGEVLYWPHISRLVTLAIPASLEY